MNILTMGEVDLAGKRVLVRQDLNLPIDDGHITSDTRLRAALPTVQQALSAGAAVMVMSHLGRPQEGVFEPSASLAPVADAMSAMLGKPVRLERDWLDGV
ncbi:MAG: phosphoglycerate kinase, partial [Pseudomonadota bacterium]